jgi:hypothetical protein
MRRLRRPWTSAATFKRKRPLPLNKVATLAELHYENHVVAAGLLSVPETGTMATLIPFVGGALNHDDFKIQSFLTARGKPLEHFVLIRQPELSEIETEIVERLPDELSPSLIGDAAFFVMPGVVAGLVVIGLLLVAGAALLHVARGQIHAEAGAGAGDAGAGDAGAGDAGAGDDGGNPILRAFDVTELGTIDPAASVGALLATRTAWLMANASKL